MDKRSIRAERSRAAMRSAFLELLQTKEPEEVTVVELCQKAGVNRSTFYAHYDYMEKLIHETLWETVAQVFAGMETQWNLPLEIGGADRKVIAAYLHRFLNDPTLRRFCTCANSGNYRTLITRAQVDLTLGPTKDPTTYYIAYFQNAGVLNLLLEWFNTGSSIPEESIVEIIHEFSKVMYK